MTWPDGTWLPSRPKSSLQMREPAVQKRPFPDAADKSSAGLISAMALAMSHPATVLAACPYRAGVLNAEPGGGRVGWPRSGATLSARGRFGSAL
jgi:hypothetical protein